MSEHESRQSEPAHAEADHSEDPRKGHTGDQMPEENPAADKSGGPQATDAERASSRAPDTTGSGQDSGRAPDATGADEADDGSAEDGSQSTGDAAD